MLYQNYKTRFQLVILLIILSLNLSANNDSKESDKEFRVIDMHVHTFNLRYLPIQGILERFRMPKFLAKPISKYLISRTGDSFDYPKDESELESTSAFMSTFSAGIEEYNINERKLDEYIFKELKRGKDNEFAFMSGDDSYDSDIDDVSILSDYFFSNDETLNIQGNQANFTSLNFALANNFSKSDVKNTLSKFTLSEKVLGVLKYVLNFKGKIKRYMRFLRILMMSEKELIKFLMTEEFPQTELFVSHLMDLENVYGKSPNIKFSEQIRRTSELAANNKKLVFFGAFDPFRDKGSLELVKLAKSKGAIGIKFYPPSGYSPSNMKIPKKPSVWKFWRWGERKQWKKRYKQYKQSTMLDEANLRFFKYAHENNLVIFSHHTTSGFEAGSKYGKKFGSPGYWVDVLKEIPDLKLVLGHAGGGEGWFGTMKGTYSAQAYNLCVLYENVYCDFGFFNEVLDKSKADILKQNIRDLMSMKCQTKAEADEFRNKSVSEWIDTNKAIEIAPWVYPISKKFEFATDWMMVSRLQGQRNFIEAFEYVFSDDLEIYKDDFFYNNSHRIMFESSNLTARYCDG